VTEHTHADGMKHDVNEPFITTAMAVRDDTMLAIMASPDFAMFGIGSSRLLFPNLPALLRTTNALMLLCQQWDEFLPQDSPLRLVQSPEGEAGSVVDSTIAPIDPGLRDRLSDLLDGVDLSGLDNEPQA
jgi:hypothetical protein